MTYDYYGYHRRNISESSSTEIGESLAHVMAVRLFKCGQKHRMAIKNAIREIESLGTGVDPLLFDAKVSLTHLAAALLSNESDITGNPTMAREIEDHTNQARYSVQDFIRKGNGQSQLPIARKVEKVLVDMTNCARTMRAESVEVTENDSMAFYKDSPPMQLKKGKKYALGFILVTVKDSGTPYRSGDYKTNGVSYTVEFPHPADHRNIVKGHLSMEPNGACRLQVGAVTIAQATRGGFGHVIPTENYAWFVSHYRSR